MWGRVIWELRLDKPQKPEKRQAFPEIVFPKNHEIIEETSSDSCIRFLGFASLEQISFRMY